MSLQVVIELLLSAMLVRTLECLRACHKVQTMYFYVYFFWTNCATNTERADKPRTIDSLNSP